MQEWHAQNPDYAAKWYKEHKHYCRDRSRKKRGTKAYERECEVCGKKFITYLPHQVTCSKECRKGWKWRNRDRRLKQLKGTDKYISDISLKKLIRRDEGICHICGKKIDESDYSIVNGIKQVGKLYPSIDHIIPISKGGSHTWENIQLAHLSCNCKKGSRVNYKKADESEAGSVRYF